jgi:methylmalonyl-CoA mutase
MLPLFPAVSPSKWRAQVEKELAGKPFEKALFHETLEGLAIAPLYTEAPRVPRVFGDGSPFRICMHHGAGATEAELRDDIDGGADALWFSSGSTSIAAGDTAPHVLVLVDDGDLCHLGGEAAWLVSTLDFHARGADACDEVALALSTTVARLAGGPRPLLVRVAAGRDTFLELCKLRALRIALRKLIAASGEPLPFRIHAVASSRTIAARDPWVNMLRVTTELFAAVLGGADLVTPLPFDAGLSTRSALGRRLARNTGHVLREESSLGRVVDPGAGSFYLDTLTDQLARRAWDRFRAIEREGGLDAAVASGFVEARLAKARAAREDAIAKRKHAILGVSEFANPTEKLPSPPELDPLQDGFAFERLRARLEGKPLQVLLVPLATPAESSARLEFARAAFATAGVVAKVVPVAEALGSGPDVVCLCGTDESYAAHAGTVAAELRAAGARRIMLAGRPGALETDLRAAGVDAFAFLGCDLPATLASLFEVAR